MLMQPGYWPDTYWPDYYWPADYWPEYGTEAVSIIPRIFIYPIIAEEPEAEIVLNIKPPVRSRDRVSDFDINTKPVRRRSSPRPVRIDFVRGS